MMCKTSNLIRKIRSKIPNVTIRTTLIIGYPGETEKEFEELKEWVLKTRFDRLGVFAYSHEEDTTAFLLDDNVSESIKNSRVEEIMHIQMQISWELNQKKVGSEYKVLVDRKEGDYFIGRTESDSPDVDNEVLIEAVNNYLRIGEFTNVKIDKADHFDLYGSVVV